MGNRSLFICLKSISGLDVGMDGMDDNMCLVWAAGWKEREVCVLVVEMK